VRDWGYRHQFPMPIAPIQLICVSLYFVFISTSVTGPALKGPGRETACARGRFPS